MSKIVDDILKAQRAEFYAGRTENSGASIDVYALVHKLLSHDRYRGIASSWELMVEAEGLAFAFKYAKPLTKSVQTSAYHIVRNIVLK